MRRVISGLVTMLLVGLLAAPAQARQYNNFVFPRGVDIGQRARLIIHNCNDGPSWTARYRVTITDLDGNRVLRLRGTGEEVTVSDPMPDTRVRFRITDGDFDPGAYRITVKCLHIDSWGSVLGTWFVERRAFRVRG